VTIFSNEFLTSGGRSRNIEKLAQILLEDPVFVNLASSTKKIIDRLSFELSQALH
jgi:hypothetical protein